MRRDKGADGFEQNEQSVAQQCKRPEPPEIRQVGHDEAEEHQHRDRGQKQEQKKRKKTDNNQQFHDKLIPWVSVNEPTKVPHGQGVSLKNLQQSRRTAMRNQPRLRNIRPIVLRSFRIS
jgi:hypothetical protein